jgi:hypothetical protein
LAKTYWQGENLIQQDIADREVENHSTINRITHDPATENQLFDKLPEKWQSSFLIQLVLVSINRAQHALPPKLIHGDCNVALVILQ